MSALISRLHPSPSASTPSQMVAQDALKKNLSVAYLIDEALLSRPLLGDPVRVRQVRAWRPCEGATGEGLAR